MNSKELIENDTALWVTWNKTNIISLAINGIRFTNASTLTQATASINIKGWI